jgi:DNA topoisomerase VI subunit B
VTETPAPYREHFATPRAAEFFEIRALHAQTGQSAHQFAGVVIKELMDNALDAAECAGVHPQITLGLEYEYDSVITVTDNGPGIAPELVERILDFDVLVSDKAVYRSPTRGLQGNALKTVLGIPTALGSNEPIIIQSRGVHHAIRCAIDPAGELRIEHERQSSPVRDGCAITVSLPSGSLSDQGAQEGTWPRRFALFNPHATISYLAQSGESKSPVSYKSTVGAQWRKPLPNDPTSAHHYDEYALARLIFSHINGIRRGGRDVPLGEFVRTFAGLSSTAKAKAVCAQLDGIARLSEFEARPQVVTQLLAAMQAASRVPKASSLGAVPEEHYRARFEEWYGVERFWFKRTATSNGGIPFIVELALAETKEPGGLFYGFNYGATFDDPLTRLPLSAGDIATTGASSFLRRMDAYPDGTAHRAAAIHLITPYAAFLDKGKSILATAS